MKNNMRLFEGILRYTKESTLLYRLAFFCGHVLIWFMVGFAVWRGTADLATLGQFVSLPWLLTLFIAYTNSASSKAWNKNLFLRFFLNTHGLPSVHSTVAFALAFAFAYMESLFDPFSFSVLFSCALLVALGRIASGANSWKSVLIGIPLGIIGFYLVIIPIALVLILYMAIGMSGAYSNFLP